MDRPEYCNIENSLSWRNCKLMRGKSRRAVEITEIEYTSEKEKERKGEILFIR